MKTKIKLTLGARLAAEHAYTNMSSEARRDPSRVAEVILTAAAPYMGPVVAQFGQGQITETGAKDIFRYWLSGQSTAKLADRFAVSTRTINEYVTRGLVRARSRIAAGTPIATIAAENQTTPAAIRAAIDIWEARHAA